MLERMGVHSPMHTVPRLVARSQSMEPTKELSKVEVESTCTQYFVPPRQRLRGKERGGVPATSNRDHPTITPPYPLSIRSRQGSPYESQQDATVFCVLLFLRARCCTEYSVSC